jgi:glutaredoxin-related protein
MNLNDYLSHWDKALEGGIYLESYADYLSLNRVRFNRNYKTFKASEEFVKVSQRVSFPTNWIIITEPWCGDAAQSVPLIIKLIEHLPNASYTLELRDQGTLIDNYLTNGGKGIPKVIMRDEHGSDMFVWGPRTEAAQRLFNELKAEGVELKVLHESLHAWYAKDRGQSLESELLVLIQSLL